MDNQLHNSNVVICGIVRNCAKNLKRNLKIIDKIEHVALSTVVYIYENDSIDKTKSILREWGGGRNNIIISLNDSNKENNRNTIPSSKEVNCNPYFSAKRIEKMVSFRNQYMSFVHSLNQPIDYLIVIDLDVSEINYKGFISSFKFSNKWDAITANGISRGSLMKYRYHDGYALTEIGMDHLPQTEKMIFDNRSKWSLLKKKTPLIPIYSGFGGLAIIRYETVKGLYYKLMYNDDLRVEVKCEHYSLFHQINQNGGKIFINPNMTIKYQRYVDLLRTAINSIYQRITPNE